MSRARPASYNICKSHLSITNYLCVNAVHVFAIHIRIFILRWRFYGNVRAVNCTDYIGETGQCCELLFDIRLLIISIGKSDINSTQPDEPIQHHRHECGDRGLRYPGPMAQKGTCIL